MPQPIKPLTSGMAIQSQTMMHPTFGTSMCAPLETVGKVSVWNGHRQKGNLACGNPRRSGCGSQNRRLWCPSNIATKPPSFARPGDHAEYVDLESSVKLSALRARAASLNAAPSEMKSALSEHLKRHEIPR